jgi:hypothetical protein
VGRWTFGVEIRLRREAIAILIGVSHRAGIRAVPLDEGFKEMLSRALAG